MARRLTGGLATIITRRVRHDGAVRQPNYYDACKVKLYTKYDDAADTSGSCGLITRRKDLHAPTNPTGFALLRVDHFYKSRPKLIMEKSSNMRGGPRPAFLALTPYYLGHE